MATWGKRCARRLIELGVPLALGTGGGPMGGAPSTMLERPVRLWHARDDAAEALIASTVNAAFAAGSATTLGRWSRASAPTC